MYLRRVTNIFVATLLIVLLVASTAITQTAPRFPKSIRNGNSNANSRRPTLQDMILSEKSPPPQRNILNAGIDKPKQKSDSFRNDLLTIPNWSDSYTYQELKYSFTMVGTNPKRGSATTTIPTVIIPLRFVFEVGTPIEVDGHPQIDDILRSVELETGAIEKIVNSPIFRPHDFIVGGVSVGNTQYGDAFQRANFWESVSGRSRDYHVLLGQPSVRPTVDVMVPNDPNLVALYAFSSGQLSDASIRADFFRQAIEEAIRQSGASPQSLPIVLYDGRAALYDQWYYMKGYSQGSHLQTGFHDTFDVAGGIQTFIASPVFDRLHHTIFDDDVVGFGTSTAYYLSEHILDWLNDPFNANFTPGYQYGGTLRVHPTFQCFSDEFYDKLRVGGVIAGELPPFVPPDWYPAPDPEAGWWIFRHNQATGYPIDTETGRYTLANGSFLDAYAHRERTHSPGGRYTFFDVITIAFKPDENGHPAIPFRAPDIQITAPANPCVGHVEIEKHVVEYPDALWTRAYGINNAGTIVGEFADAANVRHAFVLDRGRFTQFDYPDARLTIPNAINDRGHIVGTYYDSALVPHGFLYSENTFRRIDFPESSDTIVRSINNLGDITGMYDATQVVTHGFIFEEGRYRTIDSPIWNVPDYVVPQTDVSGINDRGQMIGFSWFTDLEFNEQQPQNPFSLDRGVFTVLPDFRQNTSEFTYPRTINNSGEYGGRHANPAAFPNNNNGNFGFVTIHGFPHTIYGYGVFGMNDLGQIVGYDFDRDRLRWVGYVATLPK